MTVKIWLTLLLCVTILAPLPAQAATTAPAAELLQDGGFEAGGAAWTQTSTAGNALVSGDYAHSGSLGAYLAGNVGATVDRLSQKVFLPDDVVVRLSFWWALRTSESGAAADKLQVNVRNASGGLLKTLVTLDNTSLEPWLWEHRVYDLAMFGGQTVQIEFIATTDATLITDFWVDDVSVQTGGPLRKTLLPLVLRK